MFKYPVETPPLVFFDVFPKTLRYVFFNETTIETIYPSTSWNPHLQIGEIKKHVQTYYSCSLVYFVTSNCINFNQILAFILSIDNDDMVAWVASVSMRLRRTRVKDRAKNGVSSSRSSVFLCSETTRKRLLRRLMPWWRHRNVVFDVFLYLIFILKLEEYLVKYQLFAIHCRPCRGWGCWYNNASLLFIRGYSQHCF